MASMRAFLLVGLVSLAAVRPFSPPTGAAPNCSHLPPSDAPAVVPNDNRSPAGGPRDGVLALRLVLPDTRWYPEGREGCGIGVAAFAEEGKPAQPPPAQGRTPDGPVAITNVTVIDVVNGARLPDRTVLVQNRRITAVDTAPRVAVPPGTQRVDGRGRYLIPGLWDMHVHLVSDRLARTNTFPLLIANGVMGVRDMWGDCDSVCARDDADYFRPVPAAQVQTWKRDVASGALVGPRIVASSAIFDGPSPMFPGSSAIRSPDEARAKVKRARDLGADFIKVLPGLTRESYLAVIEEAKRHGLPVSGHLPDAMSPREVSDAGQASIEHVDALVGLGPGRANCSSQPDSVRAAFFAIMRSQDSAAAARGRLQTIYRRLLAESHSPEVCADLFAHFRRNGTWRVPTFVVQHRPILARLGDSTILSDPRLRYVSSRILQVWRRPPPSVPPQTAEDSAAMRGVARLVVTLAGQLQRAGVPLLVGTDFPNPWVIPGFSVHDELALLVNGGLTPIEALQAATLNPARFLHATDSLGVIAPGKLANVVLLDADPLADIRNTDRIAAVIVNGRLLDRAALDELLAGAERAVQDASPPRTHADRALRGPASRSIPRTDERN